MLVVVVWSTKETRSHLNIKLQIQVAPRQTDFLVILVINQFSEQIMFL